MLAGRWVRRFEANRENRTEPRWDHPCDLFPETMAVLGRSLSHFQLGESGGGTFLLRGANAVAATRDDPEYPRALRLFIGEENEHARLLSHLVVRYDAEPTREHWTHFLFHWIRQAAGIDFELQVLVTAELIGNAYYEVVGRHTTDPVLREVTELILRDEAMHIEFHQDRLHDAIASRPALSRAAWNAAFIALFEAALAVAWLDHGSAVKAVGGTRAELFGSARRQRMSFLAALRAPVIAPA